MTRKPRRNGRAGWATKANVSGHLRGWLMETQEWDGGRVYISWVEDKGPRRAINIPAWLLSSVVERVRERGLFYGLGTVLGGKPEMDSLIKKTRKRK